MDALAASSEETDDVIIPDPDKPKKGPKAKAEKKVTPPYRQGMFVKPLTQMYAMGGAALLPFDQKCGTVIMQSAETCAQSLDTLAKTNPAIRRALSTLLETGAWGAVIAAHAPIIIAVSTHHVPIVQSVLAKAATAGIPTTEDSN